MSSLASQGLSSWRPGDAQQERAAMDEAERQIAECDEMFRYRLSVEIDDVEIDA